MRVVLARAAAADLESIGDWIAQDSPRRAITFVRELRERCDALGRRPRSYPLVPRFEAEGIRRRVFGDYLIFFRIGEREIVVIHILHGARDYEPLLSADI